MTCICGDCNDQFDIRPSRMCPTCGADALMYCDRYGDQEFYADVRRRRKAGMRQTIDAGYDAFRILRDVSREFDYREFLS